MCDSDRWVGVRVLRQDRPDEASYWEGFRVPYEAGLNVTGVLQRISADPRNVAGRQVAPVAYDACCLEEVCGSCTMLINGRVRQACSTLVSKVVSGDGEILELRPMGKFPVVRDLIVDRRRLFRALEKVRAWIPVDGFHDLGPGPRQSPREQEAAYPLSQCMSCGCCLEACPQYLLTEVHRVGGESDSDFKAREDVEFDRHFLGAHAMNQVVLMNSHPTGRFTAAERLDAVTAEGGVQLCGKAQNCTAVCPKQIPLTDSWGRIGRATTLHMIKNLFDG